MLNQCQFIGHLGRDPETRTFSNGNKVCNLRLAVSERWRDKQSGEQKEKTEWIPVSVFQDGLIRVCEQYLRKGSKIYVSGKFVTRKYQDQSGQDRYSTEVVLQGFGGTLVMLDGKSQDGGYQSQGSAPAGGAPSGGFDDGFADEVPF